MPTSTLKPLIPAFALATAMAFNTLPSLAEDMGADVAPDKPVLVESGTVDVEAESMRLIIGGAKGTVVLHYNGQDYKYKMSGVSAGGVGYTDIKSKGIVYNLNKVEDFAGTYSGATAGVAVVGAVGASSWQNSKGVVVSMKATDSKGLALNLGLNAVTVEPAE